MVQTVFAASVHFLNSLVCSSIATWTGHRQVVYSKGQRVSVLRRLR